MADIPKIELTTEQVVSSMRTIMFQKAGDTSWELFSKTFGWFQFKKKLSDESIAEFERIWKEKDSQQKAK